MKVSLKHTLLSHNLITILSLLIGNSIGTNILDLYCGLVWFLNTLVRYVNPLALTETNVSTLLPLMMGRSSALIMLIINW